MDQRIINLYDEYIHKPLTRSVFISRLAELTGGMTAAMAILPMIEVDLSKADITTADELFTEYINYAGVQGEMKAYVARPKAENKYKTVIVIHENRGLNAHIEDVARRVANAGFLAIAPNALSPLGRTFANEDEARAAFRDLKNEDNVMNFGKAIEYAKSRKDCDGNVGCVGFCWGGAMANSLAVHVPELKAAVAFYGRQPAVENVPKIKSAVQLHYGSLDEGVNAGIPAYEAALKTNNIRFELYMYEGAQHAFHNDTAPTRYNEAAAKLAWSRTIDFFKKYL
ncbi:MAG: dienelactone hydrolase family protein [Saprospiraceae bacterium]|nr:dienelactone hydrolase family protein [Saprospiraceae bacterium]